MRDVRVCVLGDSFVAGVGDMSGLGWVGRLAGRAAEKSVALTGYHPGAVGYERLAEVLVPPVVRWITDPAP